MGNIVIRNNHDEKYRHVVNSDRIQIDGFNSFGWHTQHKASFYLKPQYYKTCFEFYFCVKGKGTFTVNDVEYQIFGGEVFVIKPKEIFSIALSMSLFEMYWFQLDISKAKNFLGLSPSWSQSLIAGLSNIQNRVLHLSIAKMRSLLVELDNIIYRDSESHSQHALGLLLQILCLIIEGDRFHGDLHQNGINKMTPALNYIFNNLTENIQISQLAQICNLSESFFKKQFREVVGITPREYINHQKINYATQLLLEGKSVIDVSMRLSFSSSNYFSTVFRQFTGQSPTEFVKSKNDPFKLAGHSEKRY